MTRQERRAAGRHFQRGLLSGTALCAALFLSVASLPALAADHVFSAVKVEGNTLIEPATILKLAGIPKGQPVSDAGLNDAVQRLTASGLFATVDVVPSGKTLVIRVTENPTINAISIEGNRRIKDEDLTKLIKSQSRKVYSAKQAEDDAANITQAYVAQGRIAARVEPKVIDRGDNKVDLVFEIREGKVSEVERLSFTGNRDFSDRRLRQVLATKQAGLFRALIRSDTFVPDRIEADKQLLLDFYHSRGYIDAQVRGVSSEFSRERNGFFLTFNIQEGQRYSFNHISTVSEYDGVDAADFAKVVRIRPGAVYSPVAIDTTIHRMEAIAEKKGIEFLSIDPRITRNPQTQTLDVTFVLTKGPRVFVERIDIEGNATTQDKVIRRQFKIAEGDPFNPRAIREAADRIRKLDYFKTSDVSAKQGNSEDQVIVDVNVEEKPTGSLTFGASYSVADGIGLNVGVTESNFLGRGQYLSLSLSTTSDNNDNSFTFIEPSLLDRDLKLKLSGWYNTTDNAHSRFATKRLGAQAGIEFPIAEQMRLDLHYKLSSDKITKVSTGSSPLLLADQARGAEVTSAVGYVLSYDTRITGLNPNGGLLLTFGQDFAGLGGDIKTVTTNANATYETKVMHEEVTLHAEADAGVVTALNGGTTRYLDRFTGNGKVLGFEPNGFGPRDLSVPNQDALGGNYYAAVRLDARFPLGLPEEYGITGGVFANAGSVWGLNNPGAIDDRMHLRASVGVSLYWDSALGPLRINFAKPLKKESYDKEQTFDLTISTKF